MPGFVTEQVDIPREQLVFPRADQTGGGMAEAATPFLGGGVQARLRASPAGTVQFAPGFDVTKLTGEIWDTAQ